MNVETLVSLSLVKYRGANETCDLPKDNIGKYHLSLRFYVLHFNRHLLCAIVGTTIATFVNGCAQITFFDSAVSGSVQSFSDPKKAKMLGSPGTFEACDFRRTESIFTRSEVLWAGPLLRTA